MERCWVGFFWEGGGREEGWTLDIKCTTVSWVGGRFTFLSSMILILLLLPSPSTWAQNSNLSWKISLVAEVIITASRESVWGTMCSKTIPRALGRLPFRQICGNWSPNATDSYSRYSWYRYDVIPYTVSIKKIYDNFFIYIVQVIFAAKTKCLTCTKCIRQSWQ